MRHTTPAMPSYLDEDANPTLPDLVRRAADEHGDRDFLVFGEQRLSFADVERLSGQWARGLLALGIQKASRVAILMPNVPDWVTAFFATARAGALTVSLSTFFKGPEIDWALAHLDVNTLIVSPSYLKTDYLDLLERYVPGLKEQTSPELLLPEHPYLRRIIVMGECDRPWALQGPRAIEEAARASPAIDERFLAKVEANVTPADLLVTICTSGTTDFPKAVVHTHGTAIRAIEKFLSYIDMQADDRLYAAMPFFWIGGLNANLLPALFMGARLCFSDSPRPADVAKMAREEGVTKLVGWATQIQGVLEADADIPTLRHASNPVGPVYPGGSWLGMTETFGMHSIEPIGMLMPPGKTGTYGRALPGVERRIVDRSTGEQAKPGVVGDLYVRGFTLMNGYYKKEREDVFTEDGFFATGDLAAIDRDGFLFFHGRGTEMIKTSGANVSPREVELALSRCEGVREAIVFGRPDPVKEEAVVAVVVPSDGAVIDAASLTSQLRDAISTYKVPSEIVVMGFDEVPRTGSAKARKQDLLALLLERNLVGEGA